MIFIYLFTFIELCTLLCRAIAFVCSRLVVHYMLVSMERMQASYRVFRRPTMSQLNPMVTTVCASTVSSVLKTCGKSELHTGRSRSSLVARWPSCGAVCACPGSSCGTIGALLSDWQTAGERYDGGVRPAVWLSFGSIQKHIKMQLSVSSVHNFFLPPTSWATLTHIPGQSRQEKWWWEHMAPKFTKMHFGKVCKCGRRDQTFCCQGRKKESDT